MTGNTNFFLRRERKAFAIGWCKFILEIDITLRYSEEKSKKSRTKFIISNTQLIFFLAPSPLRNYAAVREFYLTATNFFVLFTAEEWPALQFSTHVCSCFCTGHVTVFEQFFVMLKFCFVFLFDIIFLFSLLVCRIKIYENRIKNLKVMRFVNVLASPSRVELPLCYGVLLFVRPGFILRKFIYPEYRQEGKQRFPIIKRISWLCCKLALY